MCNLYSMTKNVDAFRRRFGAINTMSVIYYAAGIFPDYPAPIVRNAAGERAIVMARWGIPSAQFALMESATKRDKAEGQGPACRSRGDAGSRAGQRWLVPPQTGASCRSHRFLTVRRCPSGLRSTSAGRLLALAGIWTSWTCVRKARGEGGVTADVYGFLTCQPNAEVSKVLATDGRLML